MADEADEGEIITLNTCHHASVKVEVTTMTWRQIITIISVGSEIRRAS